MDRGEVRERPSRTLFDSREGRAAFDTPPNQRWLRQKGPSVLHIRRADAADVSTVVGILIASKAASFPDTIDDHDRDVSFWTDRWRRYITKGSRAQQSRGDGWVFLAELEGVAVGYAAYHHSARLGCDAELQNTYVLKEAQGEGVGTRLLGVIAHRLHADGSRTMCVGYDSKSPYKRFYLKHGAVETAPGSPWAIWPDLGALAARLPPPSAELMTGLQQERKSWLGLSRRRRIRS
jgi:GNAT superfamily N-acetyltransferase